MANRSSIRKISAARLMQTQSWNILIAASAVVALVTEVATWFHNRNWNLIGWFLAAVSSLVALFYLWAIWFQNRLATKAELKRDEIANYLIQMPSSGDESFYLGWVFNLSEKGRSADRQETVYITAEFSFVGVGTEGKGRALQRLESLKRLGQKVFDGMFVIVNDANKDDTKELLLRYHRVFDGNLVLLDMNMDRNNASREYPFLDFIGSDEDVGGKKAARLAFDYLTKVLSPGENEEFYVLILEAHETVVTDEMIPGDFMWDQRRIWQFRDILHKRLSASGYRVKFVSFGGTHYNQIKAKEVLRMNGGEKDYPWLSQFDLIFCANDDIALGASQTLQEMFGNGDFGIYETEGSNQRHSRSRLFDGIRKITNEYNDVDSPSIFKYEAFNTMGPRVIGYDRSRDFEREVLDGNEWLIGTVDVKQEEQAEKALRVMEELRSLSFFRRVLNGQSSIGWMNRLRNKSLSTAPEDLDVDCAQAEEASSSQQETKTRPQHHLVSGKESTLISPDVCISPILKPLLLNPPPPGEPPYIVISSR